MTSTNSLKKFENTDTNTKMFSLTEKNVYGSLAVYKQVSYEKKKKEISQANHHRHISEKSNPSSGKASGMSFRRYSRSTVITENNSSMCVIASEPHQWDKNVEVEDSDSDDPDPV